MITNKILKVTGILCLIIGLVLIVTVCFSDVSLGKKIAASFLGLLDGLFGLWIASVIPWENF